MLFRNINADPSYAQATRVLNLVSELLIDLYGTNTGAHARTAIGAAALPLNYPVIIAAEVGLPRNLIRTHIGSGSGAART